MRHLCDANVLLAIAVEVHPHHRTARDWFLGLGEGDGVVLCRATQTTLLRLLTHKIAPDFSPLTNAQSWAALDQLYADDAVAFAEEPGGLEAAWRGLSAIESASPKVWMDAYLAAFAICDGLRLATLDAGFRKFEPCGLDLQLLATS